MSKTQQTRLIEVCLDLADIQMLYIGLSMVGEHQVVRGMTNKLRFCRTMRKICSALLSTHSLDAEPERKVRENLQLADQILHDLDTVTPGKPCG